MNHLLDKYEKQLEKVMTLAEDYFKQPDTTKADKQEIIASLRALQAKIEAQITKS